MQGSGADLTWSPASRLPLPVISHAPSLNRPGETQRGVLSPETGQEGQQDQPVSPPVAVRRRWTGDKPGGRGFIHDDTGAGQLEWAIEEVSKGGRAAEASVILGPGRGGDHGNRKQEP